MCFGLPMRILSVSGGTALCEGAGRQERVSLALTGPVPEGGFVLVYLGSAMRELEQEEATAITAAIEAVAAAAQGLPFEHLIADLADREPELPAHLRGDEKGRGRENEKRERNDVATPS